MKLAGCSTPPALSPFPGWRVLYDPVRAGKPPTRSGELPHILAGYIAGSRPRVRVGEKTRADVSQFAAGNTYGGECGEVDRVWRAVTLYFRSAAAGPVDRSSHRVSAVHVRSAGGPDLVRGPTEGHLGDPRHPAPTSRISRVLCWGRRLHRLNRAAREEPAAGDRCRADFRSPPPGILIPARIGRGAGLEASKLQVPTTQRRSPGLGGGRQALLPPCPLVRATCARRTAGPAICAAHPGEEHPRQRLL